MIFCEDTRVTKKLLTLLSERHGIRPVCDRFISLHAHNEKRFVENLDPALFENFVLYLSDAGMPGISDPGALLIQWCIQHGVAFEVLPGPTAFACGFVMAGLNEHRFLFGGFLPHQGRERREALASVLSSGLPVVLYEAPHRIEQLGADLAEQAPERTVTLVKELTKRHEGVFRTTGSALPDLLKTISHKGEWMAVIGSGEARTALAVGLDRLFLKELGIAPKQLAKLLSKIEGRPVKECYDELIREN